MTCEKQETQRETALEDTLRPRISISVERVMMTKRTGFQNRSRIAQIMVRSDDAQEHEAPISLRGARKKLQHATKSRRFYPKGGGHARSAGKSIEELKKGTSCNRCGAIGHWEEDCTQPARSRKKRSPSAKGKGKSRRFRRGKDEGRGRRASSYPIVEVYNDGSKNQTSHMKVLAGYAVLDCGAAKSLCGAKLVAQMAQTCAREGKRVGDKRDTEALNESYHFRGIGNQIVSSFLKLRVPGSIDGKEVSLAPSITPGDILPLVGNDHLTLWCCSIHLYPDECRLEIPSRGMEAKLLVTTSNHILVNFADFAELMDVKRVENADTLEAEASEFGTTQRKRQVWQRVRK